MPIPAQNDFFRPFLQLLTGHASANRAQLRDLLRQQFDITDEEAQQTSGRQVTLVNRLAWCDSHLVKAGFVQKRAHANDPWLDTFQITPLGIRELDRHPTQITVGYLRQFYNGKIFRGAGSDDTASDAELDLYDAFEKLPDTFTIFHSVKWYAKSSGTIGEIDFLIAHPQLGVLVLEVKGGEISTERQGNNSIWYSRDRGGHLHEIHDPCAQADRNRWALWSLGIHRNSGSHGCTRWHPAFLRTVSDDRRQISYN